MKYDIKQATTYFLKDADFGKKSLLAYLIIMLALLFSPKEYKSFGDIYLYFVGLILSCIFQGYCIRNAHNRILKPEEGLCNWTNLFSLFQKGLCAFLGPFFSSLIYTIPFGIIWLLIIFALKLLSNVNTTFSTFGLVISCVLFIALLFVALLIACASYVSYIADLKFSSCFKIKTINKIIFQNASPFVKYIGWLVLLTLIFIGIIAALVIVPCLILGILLYVFHIPYTNASINLMVMPVVVLLPPIAAVLFGYIYSDINAQLIRYILKTDDKVEENVDN